MPHQCNTTSPHWRIATRNSNTSTTAQRCRSRILHTTSQFRRRYSPSNNTSGSSTSFTTTTCIHTSRIGSTLDPIIAGDSRQVGGVRRRGSQRAAGGWACLDARTMRGALLGSWLGGQ